MRLFIDLDETLIKTVFDYTVKKMTTGPFGTFTLGGHDRFVYLRPDLPLLEGIPFDIFTSGSDQYAQIIATMLRDAGMIVQNVYSRDDIDRAHGYLDGERGLPITLEPCALIDDLNLTMVGMEAKRKALPNLYHLQIRALTTRNTGGLGSPQELAISDYREDEAMTLEDCLKRYRELAAA